MTLPREQLGEMIYRALYEHQGGQWSANETQGVWFDAADRLTALISTAKAHALAEGVDQRAVPAELHERALASVQAYLDWCHYDETMWDACSEDMAAIGFAERRRKWVQAAMDALAAAPKAPTPEPDGSRLTQGQGVPPLNGEAILDPDEAYISAALSWYAGGPAGQNVAQAWDRIRDRLAAPPTPNPAIAELVEAAQRVLELHFLGIEKVAGAGLRYPEFVKLHGAVARALASLGGDHQAEGVG